MNPEFIDIHCHVESDDFTQDLKEVIDRMEENSTWGISVGTDVATSQAVVDLAQKYKHVYACIGVHPRDDATMEGGGWRAAFRSQPRAESPRHGRWGGKCGWLHALHEATAGTAAGAPSRRSGPRRGRRRRAAC